MQPKILVVDDEPDICKALVFLLKREGYDVQTASGGEEAIALLDRTRFDLVMTDLKMGKVDGFGVLRHAREISGDLPVIMMTAFGTIEVKRVQFNVGKHRNQVGFDHGGGGGQKRVGRDDDFVLSLKAGGHQGDAQ